MNDTVTVTPGQPLRGETAVPGDKSISHRALLIGALAEGQGRVRNFLPGGDCLATRGCLETLGIAVEFHNPDMTELSFTGRGLRGLRPPTVPLNCVRSGTTMRLLTGMMAGQTFDSVLSGEEQLLRRPMERVAAPLRPMGAQISSTNGRAPLSIHGLPLQGVEQTLAVASAQVKSAVLLAGLYAQGDTIVHEPGPSRDHTELMLKAMGAQVDSHGLTVTVHPGAVLRALDLTVPGDISSAAFPIVAALITPGSEVLLRNVGVNPTRTGLLDVLLAMGASIRLENQRLSGSEPVADLLITTSRLKGTTIQGDTVVRMIDEFPILAIAATQAEGVTTVHDAQELRVKETDRIATLVQELRALGAHIEALPDGFVIEGPTPLTGAAVDSHGDHRLAMSLAAAGLCARGQTVIHDAACASDSFPGFYELMRALGAVYD